MADKFLSHDELQHIEHANKILKEHLETVQQVTSDTEILMNSFLPTLRVYIQNISEIRHLYGLEVQHLLQSTREISLVTKNTQNLADFITQVNKLNQTLTPELVEKLRSVIK